MMKSGSEDGCFGYIMGVCPPVVGMHPGFLTMHDAVVQLT